MKTDKLFYRVFLEHPALAFELAGLTMPPDGEYQQKSIEVKETSFRLDGVLEPINPERPTLFWEAQLGVDKAFYGRWFTSIILSLYRHPRSSWQALVVYPDRQTERPPPPGFEFVLERGLVHRYYLADLRDQPDAGWAQRLLRLIILDEAEVPRAAQELSEGVKERPPGFGERQALELIEIFVVYKLPFLTLEGIRTMLNFNDISLQETMFYKEVFGKGHDEGRRNEAVQLLLRQIKRRHGPQAEAYGPRLTELTLAQLEQLSLDLLDFQGLTDLDDWLESLPPGKGK
jgi:predicted transposase YdaD